MIDRMVRRATSSIFVGRVPERAQLVADLEAAARGEPGLVLIGGEAGIGKTRLVAEIEAMARRRDALVLRGHSVNVTNGSLAFAPFVEIVGRLLADAPQDVASIDAASRSELARLVPQVEAVPSARDPSSDESGLRLFHAIHAMFTVVAAERPVLLIAEDLHWADASTLDLLRFLADRLGSQRLLALATFRTDELQRNHPLRPFLAEAERLTTVERMELAHLTRLEVADQINGILGRRPPDDLVDRVFDRSDGNPFFVEELLAADVIGNAQSLTLVEVLGVRIRAMSADARAMIKVCAAIGRQADHRLLARVAGLPDEQLMRGLREAVEHNLLIPADGAGDGTFAFRHALVQELAYTELLPPERVALHASIAAALEETQAPAAEIAHHAYLAHDLPTALLRSLDAASEAVAALAFADALGHLERCLELWTVVTAPEVLTGHDRTDVLALAAHCASACGKPQRARDLARISLEDLDPIHDRDARAQVLLDLYFLETYAGNPSGRDDATFEAAELVPAMPMSALRARVLINLAGTHQMTGRAEEARQVAEHALDVARTANAPQEEAEALLRLADVLGGSFGQAVTAIGLIDQAAEILARHPRTPDQLLGRMLLLRVWRQSLAGRFQEALETVEAALRRAEQAGTLPQHRDELRAAEIGLLADLGRWQEAEALVHEARAAGIAARRSAFESFALALVRSGRLEEAAEGMRDQSSSDRQFEDLEAVEAVVLLAHAEQRVDDARTAADKAIAAVPDPVHEAALWFVLVAAIEGEADRAERARQRRRTAEAEEARRFGAQRLDLLTRSVGAAIALGGAGSIAEAVLATAQAEASRLEHRPDPSLWATVVRRRDALGQVWHGAYARFRQAQALLESRGSRSTATDLLRDSYRVADELGADPLRREIQELAGRARIKVPAAAVDESGPRGVTENGIAVSLTHREQEVLSLVAAGHTNREIGSQLFISEKTASVHITNVMNKLGALSRYEAAAAATRLGLVGRQPIEPASPDRAN